MIPRKKKSEVKTPKTKKKPDYKKRLDEVFSLYIRLRDRIPNTDSFRCISCGRILPFEQADCGHYINRQHMSLRFSEINCNAQCRSCNRFHEGNTSGYRQGLIRKHRETTVLIIESMKNEVRQYSDFEYQALIEHYRKEIHQLINKF